MEWIEVTGGKQLHGEVEVQGSKNAALPILAASILNKGISQIHHCPKIKDVFSMIKILEGIGCKVSFEKNTVWVDATNLHSYNIDANYVGTMRSSIILAGAMLGRMKQVTIAYPGGCSIGARPIDLHLKALRMMNIQIVEKENEIICQTASIEGTHIDLALPSVGATENIILAAVTANGQTTIRNAAKEPEIVELCQFLRKMGAKIWGDGTGTIYIDGVASLHDADYWVVSDRIVTGSYLMAIAATGGKATLKTDCIIQLASILDVLHQIGCKGSIGRDYVTIASTGRIKAIPIVKTCPYPGFPTDMQSQLMSVLIHADGTSMLEENMFESRYHNVGELQKMGANIEVNGLIALIHGTKNIHGAKMTAHDLRGGAGLVIAGLLAEGVSTVENIEYIERGYEDITSDLGNLGADIRVVNANEVK